MDLHRTRAHLSSSGHDSLSAEFGVQNSLSILSTEEALILNVVFFILSAVLS